MKATELRIGNWVKLNKSKNETGNYQISSGFDIYKLDESDCVDIEPIPLTEGWLERFGFGKSDEHEMGHNIGKIALYYDYHFGMMEIDTESGCQELPHIKYVHQLQNLYFALTGEELELK